MYELLFRPYYSDDAAQLDVGEREEMRALAAKHIRSARRNDRYVDVLERGTRWEFVSPDNAAMINDSDGIMRIKHTTFHCSGCEEDKEWRTDECECQRLAQEREYADED